MNMEVVGLPALRRKLSILEAQVFPRAAARALNRVATMVRTQSTREIAKAMGIRQKDVRNNITIQRARPQVDAEAIVRMRGRPLNLIRFKARETKKGVSAAPWAKRRTFPQAFVASINGTDVVMIREKRGDRRVARLPIRPLHGPAIAKTAAEETISMASRALITTHLRLRLQHELDFAVRNLAK